jgi:hypothetical protein
MGQNSIVAMGSMAQGSNPGEGKIFCTHPDHPWGTPSLLHNWYQVIPGAEAARVGIQRYSYASNVPLHLHSRL